MFTVVDKVKKKNMVGKAENLGYLHKLLFPQCFPLHSLSGLLPHSHTMTPFGGSGN